ncbi:putative WD repeat-containing protein C9G1,05 OS=Schizosaccharomyces pombe (strain 972 / ATCC 24843) GN=SPAC9G1.05 PE=3 SV=1 [Rhizoctonia solani AG-1 IB]|uniref:Putative WD repeat-containing protein C9G1,05 n=1 Tax=Thanatephorus cucumeris (strain AG1-IB / isolate 7/3/14) TaxID=1108050 RepID=A0A0B7FM18_THACB|nr:putative WD repeat-containing protein C9G1,05 OS=Schizosaccharomyces pombe (strain 972 / ATCC 24843) GN=SPAC9G1.05 PE=3 SV=1 [Rhizoctonia solani AG-1 IB]
MSFIAEKIYPCNPSTTRGSSTKLSSSGDKIVYTNGRSVVIRDLNTPAFGITYSQHVQPATVARISPSGYYCASADSGGNVKIWDIAGTDQVLKNEKKAISGKINDLAWDADSQRIIAVGDGREKFGVAFNAESSNSVGDITGHSKVLNATSIRHKRPFRAVTAGDDSTIVFYTGVPFKYSSSISTHTRFVQDVQFSPSGDVFASVGSDMKAFLYNGETGETLSELAGAHKGSIMACAWSSDSASLLTSSMDRTVKLWDVETHQSVVTWTLGSGIEHQQVGNTWAGDNLVSLSLNGTLNIFDKRDGSKPSRTLYGPTHSISSITSPSPGTFLTGSNDGRVISFTTAEGAQPVSGEAHKSQIVALAQSDDKVYSVAFDDSVRSIDVAENKFSTTSNPTSGQPKDVAVSGSTVYVATINGVQVLEGGKEKYKLPVNNPVTAIAVHGKTVAAGSEDKLTTLYEWDGNGLKELGKLTSNKGAITAIAFSPDGSLVAIADSVGKIYVYNVAKKEVIISTWVFHTARVYSLAWTADGKHCASGSLDTHIYVYSVDSPNKNISAKNAHANGVTGVVWIGEGLLASSGADGCVKTWKITPPS